VNFLLYISTNADIFGRGSCGDILIALIWTNDYSQIKYWFGKLHSDVLQCTRVKG